MQEIAGIPVDVYKKIGYSDADIAYILEQSEAYRKRWNSISFEGVPEIVLREFMRKAISSFETGMAIGFAKARDIPGAAKKFGFAP